MLEALPAFIWIPELEFWIDQYENNPKHLAKRPQRLLLVFVVGLETVAQLTESWGPWLNLTQTLWGPRHSGAPDILGGPRHSGPQTLWTMSAILLLCNSFEQFCCTINVTDIQIMYWFSWFLLPRHKNQESFASWSGSINYWTLE